MKGYKSNTMTVRDGGKEAERWMLCTNPRMLSPQFLYTFGKQAWFLKWGKFKMCYLYLHLWVFIFVFINWKFISNIVASPQNN